MKNKGSFLILTGLLLIVAALCLVLWNLAEDARATNMAATIMDELLPDVIESPASGTVPFTVPASPQSEQIIPEVPVKIVDGNSYIAVITIPALNLELPVFSSWDYGKLSVAPCCFSGSVYSNDFVVCAHNYSGHFGQIKNLSFGDEVTVVDMDGNVFSYKVVEIETLSPTAVEAMIQPTTWDLTLFTCTVGGQTRVAVRCEKN